MNLANSDQSSPNKIYFADSSVIYLANDVLSFVEKSAGKRNSSVIDVLLTSLWLMLNPKRFDVNKSCEDEIKPSPVKEDLENADKKILDDDQPPEINKIQQNSNDNVQFLPNEEELANIFNGQKCDTLQPTGGPVSPYTLPITSPISTASGEESNMEGFGNDPDKGDDVISKHIKETPFSTVSFTSLISQNKDVLPLVKSDSADPLVLEHKSGLPVISPEISTNSQMTNCRFSVMSSDIDAVKYSCDIAGNNVLSHSADTCAFNASNLMSYPDFNHMESVLNTSILDTPTFQSSSRSAFASVDNSAESPLNLHLLPNTSNSSCYASSEDLSNTTDSVSGSNSDNKENDAPILESEHSPTSCTFNPIDKLSTAISSPCSIEMAPKLEKELVGNCIEDISIEDSNENTAQSEINMKDSVPVLTAESRDQSILYTIERVSPDPSDNGMELECDDSNNQESLVAEIVNNDDTHRAEPTDFTDADNDTTNGNTCEDNSVSSESPFEIVSNISKQEKVEKSHEEYDDNLNVKFADISSEQHSAIDISLGDSTVADSLDSEMATQDGSSTCEYSGSGIEADMDGDMCIKIVDVAGGVVFTESDSSSDSFAFGQSVNASKTMPTLVSALNTPPESNRKISSLSVSDQLLNGTPNITLEVGANVAQQPVINDGVSSATDPRAQWLHNYVDHLGNNPEAMASLFQGNVDKKMQNTSNNVTSLLKATIEPLLMRSPVRSEGGFRVKTTPFMFASVTSNPTWTLPTQSVTNSFPQNFQNPLYAGSQMFSGIETTSPINLNMGQPYADTLQVQNSVIQDQLSSKRPLLYVNSMGMVVQSPTKKPKLGKLGNKDASLSPLPVQPILMMQNIHNSIPELPTMSDIHGKVPPLQIGNTYPTVGDSRRMSSGFEILVENAEENHEMLAPIQTVKPSKLQKLKSKKKRSRKKNKPQEKRTRDLTNIHTLRDGTTGKFLPASAPISNHKSVLSKNKLKIKTKTNNKVHKNTSFHSRSSTSSKSMKKKKDGLNKIKSIVKIKHINKVKKEEKDIVSESKTKIMPDRKLQVYHKYDKDDKKLNIKNEKKKINIKSETKTISVASEPEIKNTDTIKAVSIPKIVYASSPVKKLAPEVEETLVHTQSSTAPKQRGRPFKLKNRLKHGKSHGNKTVQHDPSADRDAKTVTSDLSPDSGKTVNCDSSTKSSNTTKHKGKTREGRALLQLTLARQLEDANELIVNTERGAKLAAQERLNVYSEFI